MLWFISPEYVTLSRNFFMHLPLQNFSQSCSFMQESQVSLFRTKSFLVPKKRSTSKVIIAAIAILKTLLIPGFILLEDYINVSQCRYARLAKRRLRGAVWLR